MVRMSLQTRIRMGAATKIVADLLFRFGGFHFTGIIMIILPCILSVAEPISANENSQSISGFNSFFSTSYVKTLNSRPLGCMNKRRIFEDSGPSPLLAF